MNRIILVRHGECEGPGTYVGRGSDVYLTDEGREDIARRGDFLKEGGIRPSRIITSTLSRARESGAILARKLDFPLPPDGLPADSRLDETAFGLFEGLTFQEIGRKYPKESQKWFDDSWNNAPPRGESTADTAARVESFLKDISAQYDNGENDLIVVAHGGSLRLLICFLLDITPERHWHFRLTRAGSAEFRLAKGFPVLASLDN